MDNRFFEVGGVGFLFVHKTTCILLALALLKSHI